MNDPHTYMVKASDAQGLQGLAPSRASDPEEQYHKLGLYIDSIWTRDDLTPEQKADAIRNAALSLLNGAEEAEPSRPGGPEVSESQRQDAAGLMGYPIKPRKMNREELRGHLLKTHAMLDNDVLESIHRKQKARSDLRRDARRLMGLE